jgi:hypothetical protein
LDAVIEVPSAAGNRQSVVDVQVQFEEAEEPPTEEKEPAKDQNPPQIDESAEEPKQVGEEVNNEEPEELEVVAEEPDKIKAESNYMSDENPTA